jgi:hypothetical protein
MEPTTWNFLALLMQIQATKTIAKSGPELVPNGLTHTEPTPQVAPKPIQATKRALNTPIRPLFLRSASLLNFERRLDHGVPVPTRHIIPVAALAAMPCYVVIQIHINGRLT